MHWDNVSGGVYAHAPQHFVHGYVSCDAMISGEIANSCRHGTGPHTVKICITKKGNEKIWHEVLALAGPHPALRKRRRKSSLANLRDHVVWRFFGTVKIAASAHVVLLPTTADYCIYVVSTFTESKHDCRILPLG